MHILVAGCGHYTVAVIHNAITCHNLFDVIFITCYLLLPVLGHFVIDSVVSTQASTYLQ